jgi:hypothetical protein
MATIGTIAVNKAMLFSDVFSILSDIDNTAQTTAENIVV